MVDEDTAASCDHETRPERASIAPDTLERAAAIFRALGDPQRLRTLHALSEGELCVSEIAALDDEKISTVSHRLRLLRAEGLVRRRREARHVYYALDDDHVVELLRNALHHAEELGHGGH